jgi:hypothetical protein
MTEDTPKPPESFKRADDFTTKYANNIYIESTAWDLKLTFGHVEQSTEPVLVTHDFAVTIPWSQAKLILFWLRLHVETAETEIRAKIPIRQDLIPIELPKLEPGQEDDPKMMQFREIYERLRAEFLATL